MSAVCSFPACGRTALSALKIIPKRTDQPACPAIAKALVWPNVELAITLDVCVVHRPGIRDLAQVIMTETVMDDDAVWRLVED